MAISPREGAVHLTANSRVQFTVIFYVTGEACGLAMGLVMLGSKSATAIEEMVGVRSFLF